MKKQFSIVSIIVILFTSLSYADVKYVPMTIDNNLFMRINNLINTYDKKTVLYKIIGEDDNKFHVNINNKLRPSPYPLTRTNDKYINVYSIYFDMKKYDVEVEILELQLSKERLEQKRKQKRQQEKQAKLEEKQAQLEQEKQAQLEQEKQAQLEQEKQAQLEQEKQAQLKQKNKLNILNSENKTYYNSTKNKKNYNFPKSQNDYNSKEFRKQQLEDCGDLKPQSWSTGWSPDRDE